MASTDSLPIPRKNSAYRVVFHGLKNDGTLITSGTGMDSEISKDQGTFADCTNEATEIATASGVYFLDLTSTEMNADCVTVKVTWTNTGALPQVLALYPEETGDIRVSITAIADGLLTAAKFSSGFFQSIWDQAASALITSGSIGALIVAKLGLISANSFTVTAPVNPLSGDLEIVRGDDYTLSSGRALPEWSNADWTPFSLTSAASLTFKARTRYSDTVFTKAAAALSDTGVRVELTAAETDAFAVGRDAYRFDLEAELASGDLVTLAQGKIHVLDDVR
ncbi:MAG: hypothetical protein ABI835_04955 [Chloroflexota bacterium]